MRPADADPPTSSPSAGTASPTDGPGALRVRALGPLTIDGIDLRRIPSRKARTALMALVAARGRPVAVDRLVDCLWPDAATPRDPEREVAVNLSRVRAVLGRDRVLRAGAGYRLVFDWLDLDVLDELSTEAHRRADRGEHAAARAAAVAGLALVRGRLLDDGSDADWLLVDRRANERAVADLRGLAARTALAVGDLGGAAALAEENLANDPYDETAVRLLMQAHRAADRPGSALAVYATVRDRLRDDLGARPSTATSDLHLAILLENDEAASSIASAAVVADPPRTADGAPAPTTMTTTGTPTTSAVPATSATTAEPVAPALPGRRNALQALTAALDAATRSLELVVVEADPGGGKTRLVDTFASAVAATGTVVLVGRCDELGRALPLQPVADALAQHLHAVGAAGRADVLGDDARTIAPLIGSTGGPAPDAPPPTALGPSPDPDAQQVVVFAALLRTLDRMGGHRPAVLVIDDAHLAGPSTRAWVRFCLRRRDEARCLIVVTTRPDGAPIAGTRRVVLDPLDLDAVRSLVGPERAEALLLRSGGNPLLLVELAGTADGSVPESVREAVAARLRSAGPGLTDTVRSVAVLGPDVDLDLLATVLDRPALALLGDLERAVECRFLDERGDRFAFCHALVREALVSGTSAARQALLHRRAAVALQARPDADALVVAHHAALGGERDLASRALARAAALTLERSDLAEAERLLDEAIGLDPVAERFIQRGQVRVARGDFDGAAADGIAAADRGLRADALALRAWVARHRHDMDQAIRLGSEGASISADDATRASCLLVVAQAERGLGDLRGADAHLEEVLAIEGPDRSGARGWLGVLRVHQGRAADGLALLEPAVGAEADMVHGFWVEHVLQMAAHATGLLGDPARALDLLDRLTAEAERRGSAERYRGLDDNYRAWILMNLGDPAAGELNRQARDRATMPEMVVQATLDLAASSYQHGDLATAAELLAGAFPSSLSSSFSNRWRCEQRAELLQALVDLADDDAGAALERAEALGRVAGARGDARYATLAGLVAGRARHRQGDTMDLAEVETVLGKLPTVAGMEAWWLTAETAADFGVERWWRLADERAVGLASRSGDRRDRFLDHVAARHATLGRRP